MLGLAAVAPVMRSLGLGEAVAMAEFEGGGSGSFRVDLASGASVVLKTYDDFIAKVPAREVYAGRLLEGLDIPITRHLARDETKALIPHRFAVTNYLRGRRVGDLKGEPDIGDMHREMGALLRQLHSVRLPAFGHFDENGIVDPVPDNLGHMRKCAAHAFAQMRRYGAEAALVERLEAITAAREGVFAQSGGAVFAHDDLNPNNVLAERGADGRLRLTGLIDFGNARSADAVFDLAKTLFICEHEMPGSGPAIRAGYGPVDHPDPEAAHWLYTLVHRAVMWWWLRHVGYIASNAPKHDLIRDLEAMADEAG